MDWNLPSLLTCLIISHHSSFATEPLLVGSSKPIFAPPSEKVTLPCRREPPFSVKELQVIWRRPDLNPEMHVHFQRNGHEEFKNKFPSYQYRTSLFTDKLDVGNVSLKLERLELSDEGNYSCEIPSQNLKTVLQLFVGAVSKPEVSIMKPNGTGRVLQCVARSWLPQPEVEWREKGGPGMTDPVTTTVKDLDGRYTLTSTVTVYRTATNEFTCRVFVKRHNQTREHTVQVPGDMFKDSGETNTQPSNSWTPGRIALVTVLVLLVILVILLTIGMVFWCRKHRHNNQNREPGPGKPAGSSICWYNRRLKVVREPVAPVVSNTVEMPEETACLFTLPLNNSVDVSPSSEVNTSQINAPKDSVTLESVETSPLTVPVQETQNNVPLESEISVQESEALDTESHMKEYLGSPFMRLIVEDDLVYNCKVEQNTDGLGEEDDDPISKEKMQSVIGWETTPPCGEKRCDV